MSSRADGLSQSIVLENIALDSWLLTRQNCSRQIEFILESCCILLAGTKLSLALHLSVVGRYFIGEHRANQLTLIGPKCRSLLLFSELFGNISFFGSNIAYFIDPQGTINHSSVSRYVISMESNVFTFFLKEKYFFPAFSPSLVQFGCNYLSGWLSIIWLSSMMQPRQQGPTENSEICALFWVCYHQAHWGVSNEKS